MTEVVGLFFASFLAATLLPAQSEAFLFALIWQETVPVLALFIAATTGNVLGSVLNWLLGRGLNRWKERRWFPVSERNVAKAECWYQRWGKWSLLASWVPVVGDPLTFAAGALREPFWSFLLFVTIAKAGRYAVVCVVAVSSL
ncbi:DedA family protein [Cereibacter sp. SYSU M97828]|nr:DedA family protein [Cereibacter flavus]